MRLLQSWGWGIVLLDEGGRWKGSETFPGCRETPKAENQGCDGLGLERKEIAEL